MIAELTTRVMTEVHHVAPMLASAGGDVSNTTFDGLTKADLQEATSSIFDVVTSVLNEVVDNPVFLIFFVSGLVFMAVRIIRALKHA